MFDNKIKNNVLVVAAHPDDEILGCGGAILKHADNKDEVNIIFMSDGVSSRKKSALDIKKRKNQAIKVAKLLHTKPPIFLNFPDNKMDSVPLINIVKKIEKIILKIKPTIIYTHYNNDLNIDHKTTFEAVNVACRPLKKSPVKKIISFEILSSTEWKLNNIKKFNPNLYINIDKYIKRKIKAFKLYTDEIKKFPHSRSEKGIQTLANFRGLESGLKNAEAFYIYKKIS